MATAMSIPGFVPGFKDSVTSAARYGMYMFDEYGRIYRLVYNNTGASSAIGYACTYDHSTASNKGYYVQKPTTATLDRFAGIFMDTYANASEAVIMVKGHHDWALVEGTTDIVAADALKCVNAQWYMVKDVAVGTEPTYHKKAYALEAFTTNATGNKNVYVDAF